jgi:hypothetical protein
MIINCNLVNGKVTIKEFNGHTVTLVYKKSFSIGINNLKIVIFKS